MISNFLKNNDSGVYSAAIFLSGTGVNAEKLLSERTAASHWKPVVLVSDRRESAAERLGRTFGVPVVIHDLKEFYAEHGFTQTTLSTQEGRDARQAWTDALRLKLTAYSIDFGIFAGFIPLTNIVDDFPCLNIHPGDLLYRENGERVLTGLHTIPVERALIRELPYLRSSVIVVENLRADRKNIDGGFILGVSAPVPIPWDDALREKVRLCAAEREGKQRKDHKGDFLSVFAAEMLEKLKYGGDLAVFPQIVEDFAAGCFAFDNGSDVVYYKGAACRTVEYSENQQPERLI